MDGSALPVSILLIYPGFCPIDRLISRADTPFCILNWESLSQKPLSSIILFPQYHPNPTVVLYCIVYFFYSIVYKAINLLKQRIQYDIMMCVIGMKA